MRLRPRQKTFVERSVAALASRGNTLGVAPTGAGKTIMLSAVTGEMIGDGAKACVLAHRDELTAQNRSKFGRVLTALRDAENRLMFCGYDPRGYKLFIWTLSAVLCGLAGALYVPQVGIINPSEMAPTQSIEAAVWVALGGRGTLIGPLLGAGLVNGMKSWFTVAFPEYWLFALGALFIVVTLYLPKGVIGLIKRRGEE